MSRRSSTRRHACSTRPRSIRCPTRSRSPRTCCCPRSLAAPALLLGGPVLGYNLVLLLAMVVSGLGTQLLVRRVSGDRLAAFVGGALFAVGAHRWIRLAHLHAQVTLFLPLALLALDRFWERRTLGRALVVGLLLAPAGLELDLPGRDHGAGARGRRGSRRRGRARAARAAAAWPRVARSRCRLAAPVARPYLRMRAFQGVEWTMDDVATYATTLTSYAASGSRLYGGAHPAPPRSRAGPGHAVPRAGHALRSAWPGSPPRPAGIARWRSPRRPPRS